MRNITLLSMLSLAALIGCGGEEPATTTTTEPAAEAPAPDASAKADARAGGKSGGKAGGKAREAFDAAKAFSNSCATCHGAEGKGDGVAGAALDPKPANFTDPAFWAERDLEHIQNVIKNGGASVGKSALMAAFGGQYSDEEIAAIAGYLESEFKPAE
jgi:mono/diheme cytochrome c family protein